MVTVMKSPPASHEVFLSIARVEQGIAHCGGRQLEELYRMAVDTLTSCIAIPSRWAQPMPMGVITSGPERSSWPLTVVRLERSRMRTRFPGSCSCSWISADLRCLAASPDEEYAFRAAAV